ncbi:hypothetical protein [Rheinheimera baltica]|uniref:Uncharacterized protein n=1 Tax=Rheinheimera baltica TaxID=67576 RepID=A0ABT9I095_9GAMM|nr:hypothetical protein [Rheinheimera baltica]MDP5136810.1 hypothetical protein [Rheinheimera baltica]MDP5142250.1 hypothetical protein [Rheinheimera baltica]MDP5150844.1 hypothetical protein [Rheinheimera baltica]MDP5188621.1 hypothetical protein [Rheinheimera baltica]
MSNERRQMDKDVHFFWDDLNLAQKFSVAELQRYGYDLLFVRHIADCSVAVLASGNKMAAIDMEGQIDVEPNIVLRH